MQTICFGGWLDDSGLNVYRFFMGKMSQAKFENGTSYRDVTRKIEEFVNRHFILDSKQDKEENLREMLLYTMEFPEYMNHYDSLREAILDNIRSNYEQFGSDADFLTACENWITMFGDE